jgi:hypothetical protein
VGVHAPERVGIHVSTEAGRVRVRARVGEGETMTTEARPTCNQDRQTCCRCVLDKGHDGQCVCVHGMVLFWTRPPAPGPVVSGAP